MTTIDTAIDTLISEYELLEGRVSLSAGSRRSFAMEQVTAAMFNTVTGDLDPYGIDDLDEVVAGETLRFVHFVSDTLVTSMLDFRDLLAAHGYRPEDHTARLRRLLLGIWSDARDELWKYGE